MMAAAVWGRHWIGKRVVFHCDNMAVVSVVRSGMARDPGLMHLLRCLHFCAAEAGFEVSATHIEGRRNLAADALSRDRVTEFLSLVPQAQESMTEIPARLVDLLLLEQPDWTSPRWSQLFKGTLRMA